MFSRQAKIILDCILKNDTSIVAWEKIGMCRAYCDEPGEIDWTKAEWLKLEDGDECPPGHILVVLRNALPSEEEGMKMAKMFGPDDSEGTVTDGGIPKEPVENPGLEEKRDGSEGQPNNVVSCSRLNCRLLECAENREYGTKTSGAVASKDRPNPASNQLAVSSSGATRSNKECGDNTESSEERASAQTNRTVYTPTSRPILNHASVPARTHGSRTSAWVAHPPARGTPFRYMEDLAILAFLLTQDSVANIRGNQIWHRMEDYKFLPGRTWQSLRNRFLKHIQKNLKDYPEIPESLRNSQMRTLDAPEKPFPPPPVRGYRPPRACILNSRENFQQVISAWKKEFLRIQQEQQSNSDSFEDCSWDRSADWHRIVVFDEGIKSRVLQFLDKGSRCLIQGRINYRNFVGSDGMARTSTTIVANDVVLIDRQAAQKELEEELVDKV
ncbi:unnamed protein product [Cyprideis torosa]|uniref:Telomeric repeat-binding factor 2-interacting protein 1 n=1 Tax=Cyprideis torosa TaxID=163714 RepID=A0A7R8WIQ4_9CRUS|nr:unnamed protein product [Cyprideis torosa]CAG0899102.1 unnamed protein product [Cyprideis torosa]